MTGFPQLHNLQITPTPSNAPIPTSSQRARQMWNSSGPRHPPLSTIVLNPPASLEGSVASSPLLHLSLNSLLTQSLHSSIPWFPSSLLSFTSSFITSFIHLPSSTVSEYLNHQRTLISAYSIGDSSLITLVLILTDSFPVIPMHVPSVLLLNQLIYYILSHLILASLTPYVSASNRTVTPNPLLALVAHGTL